jgi:hypothetical protein
MIGSVELSLVFGPNEQVSLISLNGQGAKGDRWAPEIGLNDAQYW